MILIRFGFLAYPELYMGDGGKTCDREASEIKTVA